jgi:lipoprotein-anchoring transpeptidase ErfK/SrfK
MVGHGHHQTKTGVAQLVSDFRLFAEPAANLEHGRGVLASPDNPLGARALYLWQDGKDTLYRIHGTNEPWTIGKDVSAGCIRLTNDDVINLYDRVPVGSTVVVLPSTRAPVKRS